MIKVDCFFFHYFLDYVLWLLEFSEKSILCYFSSKFGEELSRFFIHTCLNLRFSLENM